MGPEEARAHARELIRRARRRLSGEWWNSPLTKDPPDLEPMNVLVDVLGYTQRPELSEEVALALQGRRWWTRTDYGTFIPQAEDRIYTLWSVLAHVEEALFPPESGRQMRGQGAPGAHPSPQRRALLPSQRNMETVRRRVQSAAAQAFGRGRMRAFFEHEGWWIENIRSGAQYRVFDQGSPSTPFGFEQFSAGDDE